MSGATKQHARTSIVLMTISVLVIACLVRSNAHQADSANARAKTNVNERSHQHGPRLMQPSDTQTWKTINAQRLSSDGKWFAYFYGPERWHDAAIVIRSTDSEVEYRFDVGPGSIDLQFSDDSRYVAFTTWPLLSTRNKSKQREGDIRTGARLVSLATGAAVDYPNVHRFAFSNEASHTLALHRLRADGGQPGPKATDKNGVPASADLIIRDLESGAEIIIGNVSEFAFNKSGQMLAWTISAEGQIGNGISVRELATGAVRSLDNDRATYEKLTWNTSGDALAVLKGRSDNAVEERKYSVLGVRWRAGGVTTTVYDPKQDPAFPADMTISRKRAAEWMDDQQGFLFGIAKIETQNGGAPANGPNDGTVATASRAGDGGREEQGETPTDKLPELVLWHWKDVQQQSAQAYYENYNNARDYFLATHRIDEKRFIPLSDASMREVVPPKRGRWAVGFDHREYELLASLDGRQYRDVYIVDLKTGTRRLAIRRLRWFFSVAAVYYSSHVLSQSPDGERVLFYQDGHFHVLDAASGKITNITRAVPTSFVNTEADRDVVKPPVRTLGWATDSRHVLLSDAWDVWQIPVTGAGAVNLTANGRRDDIRYAFEDTDADDTGIDLSVPQYYRMRGEWTKKAGIARGRSGKSGVEVLCWDDAEYPDVIRARRADRMVYARETRQNYPDYHASDTSLNGSHRITNGQEQVDGFVWATDARLVDYVSDGPPGVQGRKMQAALYLPANYQPGRRYPTIVHIYERLSNRFNQFDQPRFYGFMRGYYANLGYAVLAPDIRFTLNDPGMSAVWSVLPALKAAVETGVVDPDRVGLHGYSFGAYQASFLVTQTDVFKAVVAAAPVTDMVSLYGLNFEGTGNSMTGLMESGQGRFRGAYWDHWDAYLRNSPIVHVAKVKTPVLLMHNDKDDAAPFSQGLQFFNALRKLRKPAAMMQYVGAGHVLSKESQRLDMTMRVQEFFDHHLKDVPAPDWWKDGVQRSEMQKHLKSRMRPEAPPASAVPTSNGAASVEGHR